MRKILALSVAALLVMGLVGGGTWAYFSDTESSNSNTLAAGTLDLNWDGGDDTGAYVFQISSANGYPGNSGSEFKLIKNVGSFAGELDVAVSAITNTESTGSTEYVADSINGSYGELGGNATMRIWIDKGKDGAFTDGTDIVLLSGGTTSTAAATYATASATINSYDSKTFNSVIAAMGSTDEHRFYIDWEIPTATGNEVQGDSVSFNLTFTLEQADAD